jgi:hypothetical protein
LAVANAAYYECERQRQKMSKAQNTSLVPVAKKLPAIRSSRADNKIFSLYDGERHFTDREEVREFLPDILGKALARTWIDSEFQSAFDQDPSGTLEAHGVFLPTNMTIEFQRQNSDRPRIVVYEKRPDSKFKVRVLYLQLVMMAGR